MARTWHIANGHLATGEKDGGHVVILLRPEEAQARTLSHTQREVLDQLEHAAMPFLERTSTGAAGLARSLSAEEIVAQALHIASDFHRRVSSVVLMGQGEPFANYEASIAACRALNSPDALGIGARHITISTCGIIGGITRLANEPEQFTLAVSLHSAVQETRNRLMPGVKRYPLPYLYEALGTYVEKTGRRPSYEYALIGGINDTDAELEALCDFCAGTLAHVNLIPLNEVDGSPFRPSAPGRAEEFVARLGRVGVEATIRNSRGADIDAACGQLSQKLKSATH